MRRAAALFGAWLALFLAAPASAFASEFTPALSQYAHASWRVQDGDIEAQVNGVTQTKDGFLWIGTETGLERYDGTRFRHWALPNEKPVYSVAATRDGSLWVGQTFGLARVRDGRNAVVALPQGRYNAIHEDADGAIWLARTRGPANAGGLCQFKSGALRCFGAAEKQPCEFAAALAQDLKGDFWIGGSEGACRWRPGGGEIVSHGAHASDVFGVQALAAEPDGSMLVGFMRTGKGLGLQRVRAGGSQGFAEAGLDGQTLRVTALLRDRRGGLWIGTGDAGLYHIVGDRLDRFTSADGLSSNSVKALFEDREGSVWAATVGGVDRFHEHPVSAVTTREGLITDNVASVLARRDGSIWISTTDGLNVLRGGALSQIRASDGLPGHTITSMLEDHAGRMWVGVDQDLTWYDGRTFHIVRRPDGAKLGVIVSLAEDKDHDLWVVTTGRPYQLHRIRDGRYLDEVHPPGIAFPIDVAANPAGAIWITDKRPGLAIFENGAYRQVAVPKAMKPSLGLGVLRNGDVAMSGPGGVYYLHNGRWLVLDKGRGLPCNRIQSATEDLAGDLWIRGQCGLMLVKRPDLDQAVAGSQHPLKVRLLDSTDGARAGEASFSPAVAISPRGRLWFATDGVLLTVDPAHLPINGLPPPVHIEQLVADHKTYAPGKAIALPPHTRDVEIDYAGLSLFAPRKMHFRYRLTGVDDDWQDVGTRRAAFYMNLKPGKHRFQVIASNNDGVWNTLGDALSFEIRPAFYEALWFQALAVLLGLALVWLGLWARVRYVTAQIEARLSARQAERFRIAREIHDTLLQGFQGLLVRFQVVADAIPAGAAARPMMDAVLDRAESVLVEGRDRVRGLRSTIGDGASLSEELERTTFELERFGCVPIEVTSTGVARPIDAEVLSETVAIAREALSNACRHSNAAAIYCRVTFKGARLQVTCGDNGDGIDAETLKAGRREGHWGMTGMRERARRVGGSLRIRSTPGDTKVEFTLDLRIAGIRRLAARMPLWVSS